MQENEVRDKEKTVMITGTANRYQINRLKKTSHEPKFKKNAECVPPSFYETENQLCLITELLRLCTIKSPASISDKDNCYHALKKCEGLKDEKPVAPDYLYIKREIDKKLSGYKQQDQLKKRLNIDTFITLEETLHYLKDSGMQCYYCKQGLWVLYERQREMKQWTLDRKDNTIGHENNNVVISCLECNLKRRRTNQDAFLFTKQLQLVKTDE